MGQVSKTQNEMGASGTGAGDGQNVQKEVRHQKKRVTGMCVSGALGGSTIVRDQIMGTKRLL